MIDVLLGAVHRKEAWPLLLGGGWRLSTHLSDLLLVLLDLVHGFLELLPEILVVLDEDLVGLFEDALYDLISEIS